MWKKAYLFVKLVCYVFVALGAVPTLYFRGEATFATALLLMCIAFLPEVIKAFKDLVGPVE